MRCFHPGQNYSLKYILYISGNYKVAIKISIYNGLTSVLNFPFCRSLGSDHLSAVHVLHDYCNFAFKNYIYSVLVSCQGIFTSAKDFFSSLGLSVCLSMGRFSPNFVSTCSQGREDLFNIPKTFFYIIIDGGLWSLPVCQPNYKKLATRCNDGGLP